MDRKWKARLIGAATMGLAALAPATQLAEASTSTANMSVSASINNACSMNAATLNFAPYAGTVVTGSTTVSWTCSTGAPLSLAFTSANFTSGSRQLKNGTNALNYELCSDSIACATVIGNGTAETVNGGTPNLACTTAGATTTCNVFGSIPASQSTSVSGSYSDSITMTLTF